MGKYSIGARVRNGGDEGTINGKLKGERRVRFDCQDVAGEGSWWRKDELEPVASATVTVGVRPEKVANELNDGDRIVYTGKSAVISTPRLVGMKGTFHSQNGIWASVVMDDDPIKGVHIDNIEKVVEPKFKVGDRVSVTGQIQCVDAYGDDSVATVVHDGGCFYAPLSALTAA